MLIDVEDWRQFRAEKGLVSASSLPRFSFHCTVELALAFVALSSEASAGSRYGEMHPNNLGRPCC